MTTRDELLAGTSVNPSRDPIIEEFRALRRNTLRGFARVRFPGGLIFDDIAIHVATDTAGAWAMPPGRPMIGKDGELVRDSTGKVRYVGVIWFATNSTRDRWSHQIITALRLKHPEPLE